jgi:hypothetical protein
MFQEYLALGIIFFFLFRLGLQLRRNQIPRGQFVFWLCFWLIGGILVIYLKEIDLFVAQLGFSGSGIEILLYIAVIIIFYFIFRLRLKVEKMENDLTILTRNISLRDPHFSNKSKD